MKKETKIPKGKSPLEGINTFIWFAQAARPGGGSKGGKVGGTQRKFLPALQTEGLFKGSTDQKTLFTEKKNRGGYGLKREE